MVGKSLHAWYGKAALCFGLFFTLGYGAAPVVSLHILDEAGTALKQVAVGMPFILEVEVKNVRTSTNPKIRPIQYLDIEKQSMRMSIINGVSTVKHRYVAHAQEPGTYRVGPVEVEDNGAVIKSPVVVVSAGHEVVEDVRAARHKKGSAVKKTLLQVSTDKDHVMVGESVRCFVRFLFVGSDVSLQAVQMPEFSSFHILNKKGPVAGKETIQGIQYDYIEWSWDLLPQEVGVKKIPSFHAEFIQQTEDDDLFGGFHRLLRGLADRKRVSSQSLAITVEALPPFDHDVRAVGTFNNLTAAVDNAVVREGDGLVLTLELEGTGNFSMIDTIPLVGIPEGFKAYPSKSYMVAGSAHKKKFEYILQAVHKGNWEIPPQRVYYYDPESRTYEYITSLPISVSVLSGSGASRHLKKNDPEYELPPETAAEPIMQPGHELAPLALEFYAKTSMASHIPWWLFIWLVIVPGICGVMWVGRHKAHELVMRRVPSLKNKLFWLTIHKKLARACHEQSSSQLYDLFVAIVAWHTHTHAKDVTLSSMDDYMRSCGFSDSMLDEWQNFAQHLAAAQFDRSQGSEYNVLELCNGARTWVSLIKKACGEQKI